LRNGDRLVLRLCGARPVAEGEEAQLHNLVEEMAVAAGLPKPRVYLLETEAMNAFATGFRPDSAAICITRGLLKHLNRNELQGVIGHEMGHILNEDIRYATALASLVGILALVSDAIRRSLNYATGRYLQRGPNPVSLVALLLVAMFSLLAPLSAILVQRERRGGDLRGDLRVAQRFIDSKNSVLVLVTFSRSSRNSIASSSSMGWSSLRRIHIF
jgi:heat shock protein HtpX